MDRAERERLRALAAGATSGEWLERNGLVIASQSPGLRVVAEQMREYDAAFIAAANPAVVVALLDALDEADTDDDNLSRP